MKHAIFGLLDYWDFEASKRDGKGEEERARESYLVVIVMHAHCLID